MKFPHELRAGDRFYYRRSIGEEVKLWKVVATSKYFLLATNEATPTPVPIYFDHMDNPSGSYCPLADQSAGLMSLLRSAISR